VSAGLTETENEPDRPPRWPRVIVVALLLPLGILGALALSAAATIELAGAQNVPVDVRPAAVAMLEVVSAAGTLLAIFARTGRLRNRAMAGVVAASIVSLIAGLLAYGLFGLVAPILLVWLVHLAAEAYQELRAERTTDKPKPAPVPVEAKTNEPEPTPEPDPVATEFEEIVADLRDDDTGPIPNLEVERLALELMEQHNRNELRELCRAERVDGNVIAGNKRDAAMALAAKRLRERTS